MTDQDNAGQSGRNDQRKTVQGVLGEITNSSTLFSVDKGRTYKEFWTNVSDTWEGAAFAVVGTPFDEDPTQESMLLWGEPEVDILVDKLHIGPQSRVLEIGAGVGRLAYHMTPKCGHYAGADISANMLAIAEKQLEGMDASYEFVELSEARPIPFPDASFDAVYAQAVFIHLDREDCYRYMMEAYRLLKPGGRALFQFFNLLHPEGFALFDWVARSTVTPQGKVRGRVHCLTNVEVRRYIEGAGFAIDEEASDLAPVEQDFDFPVPFLNFDYYLIGVGEKPAGAGDAAQLLPRKDRVRTTGYSDAYYAYYLDSFQRKIAQHAMKEHLQPALAFLDDLETKEAVECVLELERVVLRAQRTRVDIMHLLPELAQAIGEEDGTPLAARIARRMHAVMGT